MIHIDWSLEPDIHVVANRAAELSDAIREEDPREVYEQVVNLCHCNPAKAAQMMLALAAWLDPEETTETRVRRAESITDARVARVMSA